MIFFYFFLVYLLVKKETNTQYTKLKISFPGRSGRSICFPNFHTAVILYCGFFCLRQPCRENVMLLQPDVTRVIWWLESSKKRSLWKPLCGYIITHKKPCGCWGEGALHVPASSLNCVYSMCSFLRPVQTGWEAVTTRFLLHGWRQVLNCRPAVSFNRNLEFTTKTKNANIRMKRVPNSFSRVPADTNRT